MKIENISSIDSQNMFEVLKNFPNQVREAIEIGKNAPLFPQTLGSMEFLVLGMGGSAIGGDLLKSYTSSLTGANHITINVNRGYNLPGTVTKDTNIIVSSYSGNTEETISGFIQALEITKNIICITTGGEVERLAIENNLPVIKLPAGFQPRCAVGYSFFPMLYLMMKQGIFSKEAIAETEEAIEELLKVLDSKTTEYIINDSLKNKSMEVAEGLTGRLPVFYSSYERMDIVNLRWRCQINENSKQMAFGNLLPEMNHNEINGWSKPDVVVRHSIALLLRDIDDHERVKIRFDALKEILESSVPVITLEGSGRFLLTRMFDLIYLGDWVSYYLAMMNNIDPTPIPLINKLKGILAGKS